MTEEGRGWEGEEEDGEADEKEDGGMCCCGADDETERLIGRGCTMEIRCAETSGAAVLEDDDTAATAGRDDDRKPLGAVNTLTGAPTPRPPYEAEKDEKGGGRGEGRLGAGRAAAE